MDGSGAGQSGSRPGRVSRLRREGHRHRHVSDWAPDVSIRLADMPHLPRSQDRRVARSTTDNGIGLGTPPALVTPSPYAEPVPARSRLRASKRARIVSASTLAGSGSSQPSAAQTARSSAACAFWSHVGRWWYRLVRGRVAVYAGGAGEHGAAYSRLRPETSGLGPFGAVGYNGPY